MTFKEFKDKYLIVGKSYDFDTGNGPKNGVQCVDLIMEYCFRVFKFRCKPWGNAEAYWNRFYDKSWGGFKNFNANFFRIPNSKNFVPIEGDIAVWGKNFSTRHNSGHIAICTGQGTVEVFQVWEQNATGKNDPIARNFKHFNKDFQGVLRPYQVVRADLNVRSSPKVTKFNKVGLLKKGSKVKVLDYDPYCEWAMVYFEGKKRWVSKNYLQIGG